MQVIVDRLADDAFQRLAGHDGRRPGNDQVHRMQQGSAAESGLAQAAGQQRLVQIEGLDRAIGIEIDAAQRARGRLDRTVAQRVRMAYPLVLAHFRQRLPRRAGRDGNDAVIGIIHSCQRKE